MAAGLIAVGSAHAALNQIKIDGGQVKGQIDGKIISFKGIPFAAPSRR